MVAKDKTRISVTLSRDNAAALYALATLYQMSASELVEMLVEKLEDITEKQDAEAK